MSLTVILSFVVTTIISALMIPLVIKAGNQLGIVAHMNKRTVHKHEIARIGGYAIYLSSLIGSALFFESRSSNKCYYGCRIYNFYGRAL